MAKRVKKGVRVALPADRGLSACTAFEENGVLVIRANDPSGASWVLSPRQCEALSMAAVLEDVPEPWEEMRNAVLHICGGFVPQANGRMQIVVDDLIWKRAHEVYLNWTKK